MITRPAPPATRSTSAPQCASHKVPRDSWSARRREGAHIMFVTGMFGRGDLDPLAVFADAQTAPAKVKEAEGVLADAAAAASPARRRARLQPGYKLSTRASLRRARGGGSAQRGCSRPQLCSISPSSSRYRPRRPSRSSTARSTRTRHSLDLDRAGKKQSSTDQGPGRRRALRPRRRDRATRLPPHARGQDADAELSGPMASRRFQSDAVGVTHLQSRACPA